MDRDPLMKLVPSYGYRHPRLFARVRIGAGAWLLVLTAVLYGHGSGGWWGVLLGPAAALLVSVAHRLPRAISARKISTGRDATVARMSASCSSLIMSGTGHALSAGGNTSSSVDAVSCSYEKRHHFQRRDS